MSRALLVGWRSEYLQVAFWSRKKRQRTSYGYGWTSCTTLFSFFFSFLVLNVKCWSNTKPLCTWCYNLECIPFVPRCTAMLQYPCIQCNTKNTAFYGIYNFRNIIYYAGLLIPNKCLVHQKTGRLERFRAIYYVTAYFFEIPNWILSRDWLLACCHPIMKFINRIVTLQVEMTGSSVFDYVHQQDHSEMAEQLGLGLNQSGSGLGSPQGSEEGTTASPGTYPCQSDASKVKIKLKAGRVEGGTLHWLRTTQIQLHYT